MILILGLYFYPISLCVKFISYSLGILLISIYNTKEYYVKTPLYPVTLLST